MNERERLIELMKKWTHSPSAVYGYDGLADYLLENGVVVLPCKVGDTLYIADEKANILRTEKVRTFFIGHPAYKENMPYLEMIRTDCHDIPIDNFGKTAFLTKEEAEQALKGGAANE